MLWPLATTSASDYLWLMDGENKNRNPNVTTEATHICVSRYITSYEIENACLPVQCHRSDKLPDLLIQPFQTQSALLRKICLESKSILCTLNNSFFVKVSVRQLTEYIFK